MPGMTRCCHVPLPETGSHLQVHAEEQDQQNAEPEAWDRLPDERHHRDEMIDRRLGLCCRENAERNRHHEREHEGKSRKLDRCRKTFDDHLIGRLVPYEGFAEVALQGLGDKVRVLHVPGPVEPHLRPELVDLLDGHPVGPVAENDLSRVAGEKHHPEGDDADAEHDDDRLQQAADDVPHGRLTLGSVAVSG